MFDWQPIEKLNNVPHAIRTKLGWIAVKSLDEVAAVRWDGNHWVDRRGGPVAFYGNSTFKVLD